MNYKECETCKTYHWTNENCPEEYLIIHEDYTGDEGSTFRGNTFEDAAERYASHYNQDDYPLLNEEITIEVRHPSGTSKKFKIHAEPSINFYIDEAD